MSIAAQISTNPATLSPSAGKADRVQSAEVTSNPGDGAEFRAALERHTNAGAEAKAHSVGLEPRASGAHQPSLGDELVARTSELASDVKKDHEHVSQMLEQATRNSDSMQLMKAMMAINDYQMRVQFISKTTSKATSAVDKLTSLQ